MQNIIEQIKLSPALRAFLDGTDYDRSTSDHDPAVTKNDNLPSGITDGSLMTVLRNELDLLSQDLFEKHKACHFILESLAEMESPNERSNPDELRRRIYGELRWLGWDKKEFVRETYEDEVRWLKRMVTKTIGRNRRS